MIEIVKHHPASLEQKCSMNIYCYRLKTHSVGISMARGPHVACKHHFWNSLTSLLWSTSNWCWSWRHCCDHTSAVTCVHFSSWRRGLSQTWHPVRDTSPEGASRPPEPQVLPYTWLWAPSSKVRSQNRGWRHKGCSWPQWNVRLSWDGALASCPDTLAEMNVSHE